MAWGDEGFVVRGGPPVVDVEPLFSSIFSVYEKLRKLGFVCIDGKVIVLEEGESDHA